MLKILKALGVAAAFLSASVLSGFITQTYILSPGNNFGAAIPTVVANFETSLQASITSSATSLTLVKGTDTAGTALSGYMCLTIDEGTASEEHVCGTAVGTAVSGLLRGIDPRDGDLEVTALKKAHTRGSSVKATDYPILGVLARIINNRETVPNGFTIASGSINFTGTGPSLGQVKYAGTTSLVYGTYQIPTWEQVKDYADALSFFGTANANTITKGISEEATSAEINAATQAGSTGAELFMNPHYFDLSNVGLALHGSIASPSASNKVLNVRDTWDNSITATKQLLSFSLTASAQGDLLYRNSNEYVNLPASNSATFLMSNGISTSPTYELVGREFSHIASAVTLTLEETNEQTAFNVPAPNVLKYASSSIRFEAYLDGISIAALNKTGTFRMYYGSTAVITCTVTADGNASNTMAGWIRGEIYAVSPSSQKGYMTLELFHDGFHQGTNSGGGVTMCSGSSSEVTTTPKNIKLTMQSGDASFGLAAVFRRATLWITR